MRIIIYIMTASDEEEDCFDTMFRNIKTGKLKAVRKIGGTYQQN